MNYNIDKLFPTPLYVVDIDKVEIDCQILKNQALSLDDSQWTSNDLNNAASDNNVLSEVQNQSVRRQIQKHVNQFVYDVLQYDIPDRCYLDIVDSWFTSNNEQSKVNWHNHAWSMVSGILCLDTIGQTVFGNDQQYSFFDFKIKEDNQWTSPEYYVPSKQGRLLIWKSELQHKIETDQQRYSLAFNVVPRGYISQGVSGRLTL